MRDPLSPYAGLRWMPDDWRRQADRVAARLRAIEAARDATARHILDGLDYPPPPSHAAHGQSIADALLRQFDVLREAEAVGPEAIHLLARLVAAVRSEH
jgi:hypothetical protein